MSNQGHLSNDDCGKMAAYLLNNGTERITLAHLSKENNTPAAAYKTVAAAIRTEGLPIKDGQVTVAPRAQMSRVYLG